jgi:phosphate acetyltransferase
MALLEKLTKRAQKIYPRILLPESSDQRVIQAALSLSTQKIAKIILLGNKEEICSQLDQSSENKKHDLEFIDPKDEKLKNDYAKTLFERRKHKGLELNESLDLVNNPNVFAMLALQRDEVDGVVTGAITPSQQVLGNALRIIGVSNNTKLVSSFFLMMFDQNHHNYDQNMIFSDCAMNIDPTAEELAEIAQSAFKSAKSLDIMPKIAMLSFSTNRSTQYSQVEKVRLATSICETKLPDVDIVGNIQLDAALESKVLQIKYPETTFKPPANVLIFPNLDAANIGYKLVQRFSGAKAIGPILQGIAKPVNDLSRGCSVDEIFNTVVITANQCK